jgi:hypothetical protein
MRRAAVACLLFASSARGAEFSASIGSLRERLPFRPIGIPVKARAASAAPFTWRGAPLSVAGPDEWRRLTEKAASSPDRRLVISGAEAAFELFVLSTDRPFEGQDCPGGEIRNSFLLSRPAGGDGLDIYPARLSAVCRVGAVVHDLLSVNARADGSVADAFLDGDGFRIPGARRPDGARQPERGALEAVLKKLVALFLGPG